MCSQPTPVFGSAAPALTSYLVPVRGCVAERVNGQEHSLLVKVQHKTSPLSCLLLELVDCCVAPCAYMCGAVCGNQTRILDVLLPDSNQGMHCLIRSGLGNAVPIILLYVVYFLWLVLFSGCSYCLHRSFPD